MAEYSPVARILIGTLIMTTVAFDLTVTVTADDWPANVALVQAVFIVAATLSCWPLGMVNVLQLTCSAILLVMLTVQLDGMPPGQQQRLLGLFVRLDIVLVVLQTTAVLLTAVLDISLGIEADYEEIL